MTGLDPSQRRAGIKRSGPGSDSKPLGFKDTLEVEREGTRRHCAVSKTLAPAAGREGSSSTEVERAREGKSGGRLGGAAVLGLRRYRMSRERCPEGSGHRVRELGVRNERRW